MGVAASGLALCSFNLLFLFQANLSLIATYGAMDGGILQFLQLTGLGLYGAGLLCPLRGLSSWPH